MSELKMGVRCVETETVWGSSSVGACPCGRPLISWKRMNWGRNRKLEWEWEAEWEWMGVAWGIAAESPASSRLGANSPTRGKKRAGNGVGAWGNPEGHAQNREQEQGTVAGSGCFIFIRISRCVCVFGFNLHQIWTVCRNRLPSNCK